MGDERFGDRPQIAARRHRVLIALDVEDRTVPDLTAACGVNGNLVRYVIDKLENEGLIAFGGWRVTDASRYRCRSYRITDAGRDAMKATSRAALAEMTRVAQESGEYDR